MKLTKKLIVDSYKAIGLQPCTNTAFVCNACCPLAAISLAKGIAREKVLNEVFSNLLPLSSSEASAFIFGVDGHKLTSTSDTKKLYELGVKIGNAIRAGTLLKGA